MVKLDLTEKLEILKTESTQQQLSFNKKIILSL